MADEEDLEIYLYSSCTSCRNAEKVMTSGGRMFTRRDFFKDRFSREELEALFARTGVTPAEMLSTRSRAYKSLGLEGQDLTDDEILALMVREPTLLRRPLIVAKNETIIGFDRDRISKLAGGA